MVRCAVTVTGVKSIDIGSERAVNASDQACCWPKSQRRVASRRIPSRPVVPSRSFPLSLPFVISASCASAFYFAPSSNSSSCQKKSGNLPRPNALEFDGSAPKSGHLADSRSPETSLPLFVLRRFLLTSFLLTFSLPFLVRGSRRVFFPLFSRYETTSWTVVVPPRDKNSFARDGRYIRVDWTSRCDVARSSCSFT